MSEQEMDPQTGNAIAHLEYLLQDDKLLKRAISSAKIEADTISAHNVAGVQINIDAPKKPWRPPLQRPRRAEYFVGREAERARLLADLQSGRIVTVCVGEWERQR
jgi:hypothetical protein